MAKPRLSWLVMFWGDICRLAICLTIFHSWIYRHFVVFYIWSPGWRFFCDKRKWLPRWLLRALLMWNMIYINLPSRYPYMQLTTLLWSKSLYWSTAQTLPYSNSKLCAKTSKIGCWNTILEGGIFLSVRALVSSETDCRLLNKSHVIVKTGSINFKIYYCFTYLFTYFETGPLTVFHTGLKRIV